MTLQAIKWERQEGRLEILDQKLLPDDTRYIAIRGVGDGWKAINGMQVKKPRRPRRAFSCRYDCSAVDR